MENWQEQHNELKGEVAQLAAKMDQVLEMLANRNQPPPPLVIEDTATTEPANMVWPAFGLPPGHTPPGYVPLAGRGTFVPPPVNSAENQTGAILVQPRLVPSQEIQEDPKEAYLGPEIQSGEPKFDFDIPQLEEAKMKFKAIEDRLKTMDGVNDSLDFSSMCLVPDLVLPPKFKVPEFEKYMGLSCPKSHLIMYSRKMASYANDDKLMIHCFQDSLAGASLNWYMQLEGSHIRSWRDLANAFIKQYQYNLDMAPSRTQLQNMTQKEGESFKVYAQRWRELAAQVRPPITETKLVDMFTNTLQGAYFERMIGSVSSGFSDLVRIGERIESGLKNGKIQATTGSQGNTVKPTSSFEKKKDDEANAAPSQNGPASPIQIPYMQYPYVAVVQQTQQRTKKVFDPIPVPYSQLLPYLVHNGMVTPRALKPMTAPFPIWYNPEAKCEFHEGAEGHTLDNCIAFKHKVQELIDQKLLTFKEEGDLNREA
ncbi:hypothetical protein QL285_063239 [Trifolium repens]|nr:hypothetical protein QL285_063239 [Trifolium repens]